MSRIGAAYPSQRGTKATMAQDMSSTPKSFWQTRPTPIAALRKRLTRNERRSIIFVFFTFEIVCITVLQKFAIPIDLNVFRSHVSLGSVEFALPLTYAALAVLCLFVPPKFELNRVLLLILFLTIIIASTILVRDTYSAGSIILTIAIVLPMALTFEVSEGAYKKMLQIFLMAMIIFGAISLIQHFVQLAWTWRAWPNLDKIFPSYILDPGFVYIQPIKYGSKLMKPNGIFFLEVSYLSQWTAIALVIEYIYFRRFLRMAFYAVVLVASFAGTGLLLLAICSPVLLTKVSRKSILAVVLIFAVGLIVAIRINWYQQVNQRFTEYKQTGASANHRFVEPLYFLIDSLGEPRAIFVGQGPGAIPKGDQKIWWAVTKISYEYGLVSAIVFCILLGYYLIAGAPSKRVGFLLFVHFNLMGGFGIPVYPVLFMIIGGLFRVRENAAQHNERAVRITAQTRNSKLQPIPKFS
jgi:hypothetical protein